MRITINDLIKKCLATSPENSIKIMFNPVDPFWSD
jgi:hypothetical protein